MNSIRTPSIQVVVHLRWPVRDPATAGLSAESIERLRPYLTRYAQTLGILVHALGGTADHLHLILDIPPTLSLEAVKDELQRASARFLRDVRDVRDFAWSEDGLYYGSVQYDNVAEIAGYVLDNGVRHATGDTVPEWEWDGSGEDEEDDPPDWLGDVLKNPLRAEQGGGGATSEERRP